MAPDKILDVIENVILCRALSLSERQILLQSVEGHSYDTIAKESSYDSGYLRVVGSSLWRELSQSLGKKVTKKNVFSLLALYLDSPNSDASDSVQQPSGSISKSSNPQLASKLKPSFTTGTLPFLSGPLPLDSPFYVQRLPVEHRAFQAIERPGCLLRLKAPRRYGKSSLLLRLLTQANNLGFRTVILDFQDVDCSILKDLDRLLRWFCANVAWQLGLSARVDDVWDEALGSKVSCKAFLQEAVLQAIEEPLLIALNEVNKVFEYPQVAQDFLPLLRSCHEQAKRSASWQKLRLVMAYSTEIYVSLRLSQSPFNVGMSLRLPPFNAQAVNALAERYGMPRLGAADLSKLMRLLGGQPYLINLAFYALKEYDLSFSQLVETAPTPGGVYGEHLQRYLALLLDRPDLNSALANVVRHGKRADIDRVAAYQLASAGLVKREGYRVAMSCELYRLY
ncbi:MAG: AAA-like domain-containing protein, partial [Cyanobacteria bacterium P01_C01_bin.69]